MSPQELNKIEATVNALRAKVDEARQEFETLNSKHAELMRTHHLTPGEHIAFLNTAVQSDKGLQLALGRWEGAQSLLSALTR